MLFGVQNTQGLRKNKPGTWTLQWRHAGAIVARNTGMWNFAEKFHFISDPDFRLFSSVRSQHWLFVSDVRVKCCGKKTSHNWKPSYKTEVSLVTIWTLEGCTSSAKTVDPQFHFKGMEVWKQSHDTNTSKTQGGLEFGDEFGNNFKLDVLAEI